MKYEVIFMEKCGDQFMKKSINCMLFLILDLKQYFETGVCNF